MSRPHGSGTQRGTPLCFFKIGQIFKNGQKWHGLKGLPQGCLTLQLTPFCHLRLVRYEPKTAASDGFDAHFFTFTTTCRARGPLILCGGNKGAQGLLNMQ